MADMGYEPLDTVCLGRCLIVFLKTIANAVSFSEHLLLLHSTAVYLLLQILPVSSAPRAQGQCLVKQSEHSAKPIFFLKPTRLDYFSLYLSKLSSPKFGLVETNSKVGWEGIFFKSSVHLPPLKNWAAELSSRALL